MVLELILDVLAEIVGPELGNDGRASPELRDVYRDVGRLAAEVAGELSRGPERVGHLVRDEVDERLADGEEVELVVELVEVLDGDTVARLGVGEVRRDGRRF